MHRIVTLLCLLLFITLAGCATPDKANIELRKKNQQLESQLAAAQQEAAAAKARVASLEQGVGTLPTLPQARLDHMFTTRSITLGRLTGGADLDPQRPGDEALRIYLQPLDEHGKPLKSTGAVTIEAFDLDQDQRNRIGSWTYSPKDLKDNWREFFRLSEFVLTAPWQTIPTNTELLLEVTFTDALTGTRHSATQKITVTPPAR